MTTHPVRYLLLWLTTACNLRCLYCYCGEQPVLTMPVSGAEAALRLAAASGQPFHLQLAGGEPTLEPELIAAVGSIVRKAGWPATLALQTICTALDANLIDLCERYRIAIGLSLDGPPDVHQHVRGKAGATFRGLDLLAVHRVPVRVTTVLSAANIEHLSDLIPCLAAFPNVKGVGLDPLVRKGSALVPEALEPSAEAVRSGMRDMFAVLTQIGQLGARSIIWREQDAVVRALSGKRKIRPFCHACSGESQAVYPDGTFYPCSQTVGDPAMTAGTVDGVDWEKLRGIYRGVRLRGECKDCLLDARCPGHCPSRLTYNSGESRRMMCLVYQTIGECLRERMSREGTEGLMLDALRRRRRAMEGAAA